MVIVGFPSLTLYPRLLIQIAEVGYSSD
jgi:hypothetical protein